MVDGVYGIPDSPGSGARNCERPGTAPGSCRPAALFQGRVRLFADPATTARLLQGGSCGAALERRRGGAVGRGLWTPWRPPDPAGLRHRQLRPVRAAGGGSGHAQRGTAGGGAPGPIHWCGDGAARLPDAGSRPASAGPWPPVAIAAQHLAQCIHRWVSGWWLRRHRVNPLGLSARPRPSPGCRGHHSGTGTTTSPAGCHGGGGVEPRLWHQWHPDPLADGHGTCGQLAPDQH